MPMARTEARVSTSIWDDDEDFIDLTPGGQWLYLLLLSQADLAHDGVIGLRASRWAKRARNVTVQDVQAAIDELVDREFVIADPDEGELLIRSFIRNDKVYRQPNILRAAADHLRLVTSPAIRAALVEELGRVTKLDDISKDCLGIVQEMLDYLVKRGGSNPSPNPSRKGSGKGSDMPTPNPSKPSRNPSDMPTPGTPGERGRTNSDKYEDQIFPVPLDPDPETVAARPPAAPKLALVAEPARTLTQRSKAITDAYYDVEPMSKWPAVNAIVLKAIKADRWSDAEIHDALQRLAADGRGVTIETLRHELVGPPVSRASPLGLVERDGYRLKPETAARFDDDQRWAAQDAVRSGQQRRAIEGNAS
jgi:hypothetical protein